MHKARSRLLKHRVQLSNHVRGCLYEFGFVIATGKIAFRKQLITLLDENSSLHPFVRSTLSDLYEEYVALDKRIKLYDKKMKQLVAFLPKPLSN